MDSKQKLSASLEDYLETIFLILTEKPVVRAKEIAQRLSVSRPSVTGALQSLSREGLIHYAPYDVITLTEQGERTAREVVRRHRALHRFFVSVLGIDEEEAESAACAMEHAVSRHIVERMVTFADRVEADRLAGDRAAPGMAASRRKRTAGKAD